MGRREELLDQVTDHVLEHGLIGLTLRPLAAAIGTSDRMLIYHFGSRDALVSAVVARAGARSVACIEAMPRRAARSAPRSTGSGRRTASSPSTSCLDVYVQAAATGLIGREPYLSEARASNERWTVALRAYLVRSGAPARRVARIVTLVDSALYGFHLDLATDSADELARGVDDLARAAQALAV